MEMSADAERCWQTADSSVAVDMQWNEDAARPRETAQRGWRDMERENASAADIESIRVRDAGKRERRHGGAAEMTGHNAKSE